MGEFDKLMHSINTLQRVLEVKQLVPQIKCPEKEIEQIVMKNVKKDQLKFKYKWHFWNQYESMKLLNYLFEKQNENKEWKLNNKTLSQLFLDFDRKYSIDKLKEKCLSYGIEYIDD